MQGPKEFKRIIARVRRKIAKFQKKKNGSFGYLDSPFLERLIYNSKKNYRRNKIVEDE